MSLYRHPLVKRTLCSCSLRLPYYLFVSRDSSTSNNNYVPRPDVFDMYVESFIIKNVFTNWKRPIMNVHFNKKETQNVKIKDINATENIALLKQLTTEELFMKIDTCIQTKNIDKVILILKTCRDNKLSLPVPSILYLLKAFAKIGNKEGVEIIQDWLKTIEPETFKKENGYKQYTAQALWMQGSFKKAIFIFQEIFVVNKSLCTEGKLILCNIISDSINNRGEAALFTVKEFVENLASTYNDYYPMIILWRQLYESEWFADQEMAKELLNENKNLIEYIHWMIPMWSNHLLRTHKVNTVYRLCEILLKYDYMEGYSAVLHNLFDYYYIRGNLERCSAIVRGALDLNVPLKEAQQKRFVILLTKGKPESILNKSIDVGSSKINLTF